MVEIYLHRTWGMLSITQDLPIGKYFASILQQLVLPSKGFSTAQSRLMSYTINIFMIHNLF